MKPAPLALLFFALAACKSAPTENANASANANANANASATAHATAPVATVDISWTVPSSWKTEPSAGMRKATYSAGEASISVIQAGGSADDNVDRWKGQFDAVHDFKREEIDGKTGRITLVEMHGKFTGGGMMVGDSPDPKPGYALYAAIVPAAPTPYFFKMLGPDKAVAAARPDFRALVDSIRAK